MKIFVMFVSFFFICAISGIAIGTEKTVDHTGAATESQKKAMENQEEKTKNIKGTITAIDLNAKTISVKGKKAVESIAWDENTVIRSSDKKTIGDIKVGDSVKVKFSDEGGKKLAKSISIKMKRATTAPPPDAPSAQTTEKTK